MAPNALRTAQKRNMTPRERIHVEQIVIASSDLEVPPLTTFPTHPVLEQYTGKFTKTRSHRQRD